MTARYTIEVTRPAEKHIRALDPQVRARIEKTIDALAENPRPHGCQKMHGHGNLYRARTDDWRVVYCMKSGTTCCSFSLSPAATGGRFTGDCERGTPRESSGHGLAALRAESAIIVHRSPTLADAFATRFRQRADHGRQTAVFS